MAWVVIVEDVFAGKWSGSRLKQPKSSLDHSQPRDGFGDHNTGNPKGSRRDLGTKLDGRARILEWGKCRWKPVTDCARDDRGVA